MGAEPVASRWTYFRRLTQWTFYRIAPFHAAARVSLLAGEGTRLAMMAAYVLGRELQRSAGNHAMALFQVSGADGSGLGKKARLCGEICVRIRTAGNFGYSLLRPC